MPKWKTAILIYRPGSYFLLDNIARSVLNFPVGCRLEEGHNAERDEQETVVEDDECSQESRSADIFPIDEIFVEHETAGEHAAEEGERTSQKKDEGHRQGA